MTGQSSRPAFVPHFWLTAARLVWLSLLLLSVYTLAASIWIDPSFASVLDWSHETYQAAADGLGVSALAVDILHQVIANINRLSFLGLGVLLYFRRNDEPITLFISAFLITFSVTVGDVGHTARNHILVKDSLSLVMAIGQLLLIPICYIFPDGRWVPRWSKWPTVLTTGILLAIRFEAVRLLPWINLLSIPAMIWLLAGVPALIYRYRQLASPEQRQQMKWGAFGIASFLLLSFLLWMIFGMWLPETLPALQEQSPTALGYSLGSRSISSVASLLLPVSFTIAILRYRLWDIDVIIRRTIFYAAMTGTLGLLYLGSIVFLQQIVRAITGEAGQSTIAIVVSTLVIAALFTPLRRRLQESIDRRFYRRKYDAEQALAAFSDLTRQEVDLEEISARLLSVVRETVQPSQMSLWVKPAAARASFEQKTDER